MPECHSNGDEIIATAYFSTVCYAFYATRQTTCYIDISESFSNCAAQLYFATVSVV